ncbi:MAG: glycosyltransferase family 9 protein [Marmoricola sp.]
MSVPGTGDVVEDVQRIVVLRANALGDFVQTLPALQGLRATYPAAEVVLVGTPMHRALLADRPSPVDRVELVPRIGGRHRLPESDAEWPLVEPLLEGLRADRVDLAVQLHGGGRWSNPFVAALRPRVAVGARAPGAAPLDRCTPYQLFQHEVERMLEVVALAGVRGADPVPHLAVTPADRVAATELLGADDRPLVVLHPGGTDPRRHWPLDRLLAVGRALEADGARTLLLTEELRFPELVGVLDRAVLLVGNDSGPRHLADAVGTATVAVYWSGNLINAGPVRCARHDVHVSWRTACPVCGANGWAELYPERPGADAGCDHDASWVGDVPLPEVVDGARALYRAELDRARTARGTERTGTERTGTERKGTGPAGWRSVEREA